MSTTATRARHWQSKNPLWFIVPFVASVVALIAGQPGWALLLYIVSLVAAGVAHPDMRFKWVTVGVLVAVPVLATLIVTLSLVGVEDGPRTTGPVQSVEPPEGS